MAIHSHEEPSAELHEHDIVDASQEDQGLTAKRYIAIFSLLFLYSAVFGGYIVFVSVVAIVNADLGPTASYTWMASAYTLTSGITLLVAGALGDLLGRRWFVIACGIIDVIGSIIACTAHSVNTVIAGMAIKGVAGGLASVLLPTACELVPIRKRGYVAAATTVFVAIWSAGGSYFGHQMAVYTAPGWRSIIYMSIAMSGAGAIAVTLTYHPCKAVHLQLTGQTRRQVLLSFDYVGLAGITAGPTLLILGMIWIPQYGVQSANFIAPFVLGVVILVALGVYESRWAKNPLLHPFLFKRIRSFVMLLVTGFISGLGYFALVALLPTYLSAVYDNGNATQVGIDGIPFGIGSNFGGFIASFILSKFGRRTGTRSIVITLALLQAIFIPLMAVSPLSSKAPALAFSFIAGAGVGGSEQVTSVIIQLATPDEWIGFASGSIGMSRGIGGAIGQAIFSTVLQSKLEHFLPTAISAAALSNGLPQKSLPEFLGVLTGQVTTIPLKDVPGVTPAIVEASTFAMRSAYHRAFQWVWYISIPFGVVALVCSCLVKDLSPNLTEKLVQHIVEETPAKDEVKTEHVEYADKTAVEGQTSIA